MKKTLLATFVIIIGLVSPCYALDPNSHKDINEHIALNTINGFSLDLYLKDSLGFQGGIEESFAGGIWGSSAKFTVWQWLRDGGRYEDLPPDFSSPLYLRSVNHFHNPLTEQGFSGFIWGTLFEGMSSTQWALLPEDTQSTLCWLGCYSWDDVRGYYYTALTSTDQDTRNTNFANTFRGMGQLMHLIHDASVPAHTRNDFHVRYNYEKWVLNKANIAGYIPFVFSGAINDIASFIDTNQYNGTNPDIAVGATIGLSEYTNANFFSKDTINSSSFTYPQTEDMPIELRNFYNPDANTTYPRRYYLKNCCGETNGGQGYLLAAVDLLDAYRQKYPSLSFALKEIPVLDDNVYADYASLLIPRAVGYASGLLNYSFRGALEISAPDDFIYSITDGSQTPYQDISTGNLHQSFTKIKAKVLNTTVGEAISNGTLVAVAKYKIIPDYTYDLSNYPPDETAMQNANYSYAVSAEESITDLSSVTPTEFTFDFSASPIPAGITDLSLQVVFKGTLGNEAGAIAVGMKDLMEPTHHVFWNLTDMFLLDGQLYTSAYIKSKKNLANKVDKDKDGIFNEINNNPPEPYIDPHESMFKIGYYSDSPPVAPGDYAARVTLPAGRHIRLVVLVDDTQAYNWLRFTSADTIDSNSSADYQFQAVINQADASGTYPTPTPATLFRSLTQHFYAGIVRCYPIEVNSEGVEYCPYPLDAPAPADLTPYPAVIQFP